MRRNYNAPASTFITIPVNGRTTTTILRIFRPPSASFLNRAITRRDVPRTSFFACQEYCGDIQRGSNRRDVPRTSSPAQEITFDISNLPAGTYMLRDSASGQYWMIVKE